MIRKIPAEQRYFANHEIRAVEPSRFILVDVPSCRGWGYGPETLKGAKA